MLSGGLRRGRRIRDRGRRVGRDGVASETRCRRTHSRLRTSSASSHDSSPPRATVERRVGEWTMRASTRLASPTPARFAPGEEATRGRATAHGACTAEALIVMSGVEARRARACGEHCRVPFRRCQKSPLAAVARARSGSRSTSFVSPVRSFADPVNVPNLAEQSVWKYAKSPLKKASVSEGGRRRRMVQISARTRASRHKNRSVLKKGASQLHAGRFSVDPDPDFGRRGRCRARSPNPRALRLVAPNPIFEGIASGGSIDRRQTSAVEIDPVGRSPTSARPDRV